MSAPQTIYNVVPVAVSQPAGSSRLREIDLSMMAAPAWQPNIYVLANQIIRPTNPNESANGLDNSTGYVYKAAAAGQTGPLEPAWVTTGSVADGSVSWTPQAPLATGEDSVASASWTVTGADGELTVTGVGTTSLTASAYFKNGTSGQTYTVTALVTMTSTAVYPVVFLVSVI